MTSLPVKGFDPVSNILPVNPKVPVTPNTDFEAVLSKQTAEQEASLEVKTPQSGNNAERKEQSKETVDKKESVPSGGSKTDQEVKEAKDVKDVKDAKETSPEAEDQELPMQETEPENLEQIMEVLATAAMQLVEQITETFEVTVEDVQDVMEVQDISKTQLLEPDNLSNLLLQLEGEEDMTSLLTDENLYQSYQEVMEELTSVLTDASEQIGVTQEQLQQVIETVVTLETESFVATNEFSDQEVDTEPIQQDSIDAPNKDQEDFQTLSLEEEEESVEVKQPIRQAASRRERVEPARTIGDTSPQVERWNEPAAQTEQVADQPSVWDEDTQNIMRQVMDYMRVQLKPDMSTMEMQLHPASLGTLQVQVASKGGVLTAQFVTQNESVKAALESQMIQLQQSFEEQGVKVDAIEVTVQTHQFEQNLEQGRERQQEEPNRRTGGRRIRLDGALTLEDLEAMDEEEALAAQMMEANGNTVDYTV